jgi:phage-related protein (TIGR01555 family)
VAKRPPIRRPLRSRKPAAPKPTSGVSHTALLASQVKPRADYRVELRLPDLPPGVRPKNAPQIAMDDASGMNLPMAWANGIANGFNCGLYFPGYPYLAELAQRPEYRSPVESLAEEMTRKWIEFKSTGTEDVADKIKEIEEEFTRFGLQSKFRHAIELEGFFGRAQMYIDIKGHENDRATPLKIDPATVPQDSLLGFKVIEPLWTTPVFWNAIDPTKDDFYKPTTWYVLGTETHDSRLIMFRFRDVPDLLKPSYNFGGMSLTQMLQSYVNQYLQDRDSVSALIKAFSVMVLSTDMSSALEGGDGMALFQRLQMFNNTRDNRGTFAINHDSEEFANVSTPLGGLEGLMAQSQERMCFVTREPLVKAFGISPTGLNATSEFELVVWYDHVRAMQEKLDSAIKICLQLIQLNKWGVVDLSIVHDYVELKELDGEALARNRKSDGETDTAYITAGVVSPEEVREKIQREPDSGYQNLSGPAPAPPALQQLEAEAELAPKPNDGGDGE